MLNKRYKRSIFCIGTLVLLLMLSGCVQTPEEETDPSLSNIIDKGKIIIGSDIPYEPMEYRDESENLVGIDIDIAKKIAEEIGVTTEFVDYNWTDIFDAVKTGECDIIISSITITIDRSQEMLFSTPYLPCGQVIVVNESNQDIISPENLSGKRVGAQVNTTSIDEAKKYTDESLVFGYANFEETENGGIIYDLKNGTLDAIIVDYIAALGYVKSNPILKIAGGEENQITEEYFGIATKQGNNALIDRINDIIKDMQESGEINSIKNSYIYN